MQIAVSAYNRILVVVKRQHSCWMNDDFFQYLIPDAKDRIGQNMSTNNKHHGIETVCNILYLLVKIASNRTNVWLLLKWNCSSCIIGSCKTYLGNPQILQNKTLQNFLDLYLETLKHITMGPC